MQAKSQIISNLIEMIIICGLSWLFLECKDIHVGVVRGFPSELLVIHWRYPWWITKILLECTISLSAGYFISIDLILRLYLFCLQDLFSNEMHLSRGIPRLHSLHKWVSWGGISGRKSIQSKGGKPIPHSATCYTVISTLTKTVNGRQRER